MKLNLRREENALILSVAAPVVFFASSCEEQIQVAFIELVDKLSIGSVDSEGVVIVKVFVPDMVAEALAVDANSFVLVPFVCHVHHIAEAFVRAEVVVFCHDLFVLDVC